MIYRTLLLGLLILGVLIFGIPGLIGLYLARHFDQYTARLDQAGSVRVIDSRFQRGWFDSDARVTVRLADRFCAQPPCATLTLATTVHQGLLAFTAPPDDAAAFMPVWAVIVGHVSLHPLWPQLAFTPPLAPLHTMTRIRLDGQISSRVWWPAGHFTVTRGASSGQLTMARLLVTATTPLGDGPLMLTVVWPLLRFHGGQRGYFELQGLRAGLVTAAHDRGRIVQQHLRVNMLTVGNGKGLSARLEQIVWRAEAVPGAADGLATRFRTRIERLVLGAGAYGPLVAQGRIAGMDAALWRALRAQFKAGDTAGPSHTATLRTLYHLYLPSLLAAGPMIRVNHFALMTPAGELSGQARIAVPDGLHVATSLSALLQQVRVEFRGRVPAPLLRRGIRYIATQYDLLGRAVTAADINIAMKQLIKKELIEPLADGQAYRVQLRVAHGHIRINGHALAGWAALLQRLRQ